MEYFLECIAGSLQKEFGNTLNNHCLIFPNRRAGLYFLKYLAGKTEKPMWAPPILTINELFRSYSSLQIAGNEVLLFELYKVYCKFTKTPESFDDFYLWGDMLVNDFDDVDKYLVNASLIFQNVKDIRFIDQQFGGLTDAQIEIIKKFWVNFDSANYTDEKTGFISIWSILNELYSGFRKSLREQNLAYEGMIFRDLADQNEDGFRISSSLDKYHFIGFNALNECEKKIMTRLKKMGKARFYWDYDNSYIMEGNFNTAGLFMRGNLKTFGNDMPSDWNYNTLISPESGVTNRYVVETSSDIAQVKLVSNLINEIPGITPENAHLTAVVLADENLLMPVLTSLPENIGDINITMGYPLKQTLVYTFVRHLMDLQRTTINPDSIVRFSFRHVMNILKHSLMEGILTETDVSLIDEITKRNIIWVPAEKFSFSEKPAQIFKKPLNPADLSEYFKNILAIIALNEYKKEGQSDHSVQRNIKNEFIYRIVLSVNRLESIIQDPDIFFTTDTYMRILDRMLRIQSVPFSGEPLSGIQIMGILETRALDFKNLIILSVNEGVLPAISSGSSFIPFSLREAFYLPSVSHKESVYAYHFYRLLQRAENVTFTYNSNSEGLRSGEMSRFLIQMKYEKFLKPVFTNLGFKIESHGKIAGIIDRNEGHVNLLNARFLDNGSGRILSPSAINLWLNCRMKFYYRYVNGLKEPDKISEDIDPAMLGSILHEILRSIYQDYYGKDMHREIFDEVIKNTETLKKIVNESISLIFKDSDDSFIRGNELIVRDVLYTYIKRILNADKSLAPITLLHLEHSLNFMLEVLSGNTVINIRTGGVADRVDIVSGITRIVDYKTGSVSDTLCSIGDLFSDDKEKDSDGWLQTLVYCEAFHRMNGKTQLRPSIYNIRRLSAGSFSDQLKIKTNNKTDAIDDYGKIRDEFIYGLKNVISTIFNPAEPFNMTKDIRGKCTYCSYKVLCLR